MSLTIELSPVLETRLEEEARRRGLATEECARRLIEERLPPHKNGRKRISAFGKYAHLQTSSGAFALRKQEEIDLEDRPR